MEELAILKTCAYIKNYFPYYLCMWCAIFIFLWLGKQNFVTFLDKRKIFILTEDESEIHPIKQ